ncbi:MAG: FCD domain-containing protein [Bacillota bacterium]
MNKNYSSRELEYKLLERIEQSEQPIGASCLNLVLGRELAVSQSTIGRKLHELEFNGYLEKVGRKGRRLTEKGREYFKTLGRQLQAYQESDSLLKAMDEDSKRRLIEILITRRALEREIVGLVIEKASDRDLDMLYSIVEEQSRMIDLGQSGSDQDINFHQTLARLSGNGVLEYTLRLVLSLGGLAPVTSHIRQQMGGVITDHQEIIRALEERALSRAQAAMTNHINRLISDVELYWRSRRGH